ncbi:hypothetical protein BB558_002939 [Smittium angustum]|uniref:Aspartic peptidase DDI1-type domain-containing protein n=1 Tax=Smittium angustum TaxID=133377 RepID=A0A2U1J7J1_SMIAN|nr:hypothetical protein BB558_002939 [Smittium angustum]
MSMDLDNVFLMERIKHTDTKDQKKETVQISDLSPVYKMVSKIVNKDKENAVFEKLKEREPLVNISTYEESGNYTKPNSHKDSQNEKEWDEFHLSSGSGKVNGYINGAGVEFLLDEGSEINIMNSSVYDALNTLQWIDIDRGIKWIMRDANQGNSKLIGVCKDCKISISGIEVVVPVFVSQNTEPQVILGRPWEQKAQLLKTIEMTDLSGIR